MATRQSSNSPRYLQVADDLRAAIQRGDFGAGAQMPTETTLCARYGVSRFTVREALRQLQSEGLIRRRRGSGTVVESGTRALRQPLSDVRELLQYAAGTHFDFKAHGLVTLNPSQTRELGVSTRNHWFLFTGLRTAAGLDRPIASTEAYIHQDLWEAVPKLKPGNEPIFRQLERLAGVHIARVTQDIRAVAAGAGEAKLLGIPRRAPCLRILRCYLDSEGQLIEMSSSLHPGDLFTYSMHIDID